MVKPIAEQPRRSASCTPAVIAWVGPSLARDRLFALLTLRIVGIIPAKVDGAGLEHAERRRIGVEPGLDRELIVVMRVVGRRIGRKAARRAMLEALIDRQDDELSGAAEPALHQDAGEIGLGPGAVALVIVEDLLDSLVNAHGASFVLARRLRADLTWQAVYQKRGQAQSRGKSRYYEFNGPKLHGIPYQILPACRFRIRAIEQIERRADRAALDDGAELCRDLGKP